MFANIKVIKKYCYINNRIKLGDKDDCLKIIPLKQSFGTKIILSTNNNCVFC